MKTYPTKNIRNILILGHGGSGKTTLTEALAFNAGAVDRMGKIDEGNTLSDFDPEEKRRKLEQMVEYAELESCYREYILSYFGEPRVQDYCGFCGN